MMNAADLTRYKALLMARRDELVRQSQRREELWITHSHEQIEAVQLAGQREFAARSLEREARSLSQIRAALDRIDDCEFGVCLECEEPISPKRLAAVPWAAYCLRCQEALDAQEWTPGFEPKLAA